MSSVSGLSPAHRKEARDRIVEAAMLGLHHAPQLRYTQGPKRWDGIQRKRNAHMGQYPNWGDCSSFATWCHWNGLVIPFDVRDTVNGQHWLAGFTGTMLDHGKQVVHYKSNFLRGDCFIYGNGAPGKHTAVGVGRRKSDGKIMVVSFGSDAGPYYLPYDYRSDLMQCRRYV